MQDTQEQINMLKQELESLKGEVYKNNFSGHQDFSKFSNFTTRLKVPHYDTIPIVAEIGEILEFNGKLLICSATNQFTIVGTQS